MRIGVDARVLVHRPTGVARYLAALLAEYPALRRDGESLELFVDRPPENPLPGRADAITVLPWTLPGGDPAWRQVRLAAGLRRHPVDVLFCPFYSIPLASGVPAVVTVHDVSFAAHPEWFTPRARLAFRLSGPSARRATRVLTVSEFSKGEIAARLGVAAGAITVVYPGLERTWLVPVSEAEVTAARAWLGVDGPYLLHLGAVHARRHVDRLVHAFARLASARTDLALVVAGPSIEPAPDVVALAAELGVADRLVRREWVPEPLVRPLLAGCDALAYLSEYEGFGLPALEALACGAPVVALRRASLPEVLGSEAVWVEQPDPEDIARALHSTLAGATLSTPASRRARAATFSPVEAARSTFDALRGAALTAERKSR